MARRPGPSDQMLGGRLGPKIAKITADAMTAHLRQSADIRARIGGQAGVEFFRTIGTEKQAHLAPLLGMYLGHKDTPAELERVLQFMHHGRGELSELLAGLGVQGAVGTSIGSSIANALAPINQSLMYADPHQIPSPEQAIAFATAGIISEGEAFLVARKSGQPENISQWFLDASYNRPGLAELLELLRKGHIDPITFERELVRQAVPGWLIGGLEDLRHVRHSPEELALMVLKGIRSEADAAGEAEQSGVNPERFRETILATGEPPGLELLLEAYRRGFIGADRLEHGIRQSRVRDEWIDVVKDIRFSRASPSDAINAAVQGHLNLDQAKRIAEDGGLFPEDFQWLYDTYGTPMAPIQAITLWRRGEVTREQVEEAIREGHTKDKYIPRVLKLRRVLPAQYQIEKMLETGGISEALAAQLLHEQGYDPDVVKGLVFRATHAKVAKDKALAKSEVSQLYHDRVITEAEAVKMLAALGYTAANAELILRLVDLRREQTLQNAAMSPIRAGYVNRRINADTAVRELTTLGIEQAQIDYVIALWTADRDSIRKVLSEAQIIKANERGLFSDEAAVTRLESLGYTHEDATILLDNEKGRTVPAP